MRAIYNPHGYHSNAPVRDVQVRMFIARSATYLVVLAAMAEAHVYEDGRTTPPGRRKLQADGSAYPWWNKGGTWDISEHNKRQATKPAAPVEFGVRSPGATAPLPKIAFVGGTGRMGVHLCAAWANAGYDVTMCSRSKDKAQKIVDSLLAGSGYSEASTVGGAIAVPPCDATGWKLRAGVNDDAASADLIVLGTMFEQAWALLEALAPKIRGKGKTILDMTNPFLKRADGYGAGLPEDGPQSGIEYHKGKLGDDSVKWVGAYKSVLWTLILPCVTHSVEPRPLRDVALRQLHQLVFSAFVPLCLAALGRRTRSGRASRCLATRRRSRSCAS